MDRVYLLLPLVQIHTKSIVHHTPLPPSLQMRTILLAINMIRARRQRRSITARCRPLRRRLPPSLPPCTMLLLQPRIPLRLIFHDPRAASSGWIILTGRKYVCTPSGTQHIGRKILPGNLTSSGALSARFSRIKTDGLLSRTTRPFALLNTGKFSLLRGLVVL